LLFKAVFARREGRWLIAQLRSERLFA